MNVQYELYQTENNLVTSLPRTVFGKDNSFTLLFTLTRVVLTIRVTELFRYRNFVTYDRKTYKNVKINK